MCRHLAFALLVLIACERAGPIPARSDPGTTTAVSDSGQFRLEPHVRIDGNAEVLVSVSWIGIDKNDGIAVMQQQDRAFRFYDRDGRFLGVAGSKGEGPGEFDEIGRSGWLADTLWVSDPELRRIQLFSPERKFVRTIISPRALTGAGPDTGRFPSWSMVVPWAVFGNGSFLIAAVPGATVAGSEFTTTTLLHVAADGTVLDVVANRPASVGRIRVSDGGGRVGSASVPFYPPVVFEASPDGQRIVTITTAVQGAEVGTFRVTLQSSSGDTLFSNTYPYDGVAIPTHVIDSVIEARATNARFAEARRFYRASRDRVPKYYPPVQSVFIANDHRVWISLRRTDDGNPWLLLDVDGTPLGTFTVPRSVYLSTASSTVVWGAEIDDVGVHHPVSYRIVGARR